MKYRYSIEIHPAVNFVTKSAEIYIVDEEHNCIVSQRHIGRFASTEEAEQAADRVAEEVAAKLRVACQLELQKYREALP